MKKLLKKKIIDWFGGLEQLNKEYPDQAPKLYGTQKGVTFEVDSLSHTFCSVNEWASGEGFDISFETMTNTKTKDWEGKRMSLHTNELEAMLYCLKYLNFFGE